MAASKIRIDQSGHSTTPTGVPGRARDDIESGVQVQLHNQDNSGVRSWRWRIVDQPNITTPLSLSDPTAPNPTFTPNEAGTWLIELAVNEGRKGEVSRILVAVRDANGHRIPAAGERNEANWLNAAGVENPRGWQPDLRSLLAAGASAGGGWTEAYRLDFRDVFTSQGTVDLNSAGASVTIDGVTWRTPAVATTGVDMATANTSFGIDATGLRVVDPNSGQIRAGSTTGQIIYASLHDIAQNTRTPFDADVTREWLFQAYVSSTNADENHEGSGVFVFREGSADPISNGLPGDPANYRTMYGFINGVGPGALEGTGGTSISTSRHTVRPAGYTSPDPDPNVPSLWYASPQSYQHGGGPWNSTDDEFPALDGNMEWFGTSRDTTDVENDIVFHPRYGFFCGLGHSTENASDNLDATIQQYRILYR